MKTRHLFHQPAPLPISLILLICIVILVATVVVHVYFDSQLTLVFFCASSFAIYLFKRIIYQSPFGFTLTNSHLQQHLAKGGWVLQWQNILRIDKCECHREGWYQDIPWVGIEIKNHLQFIDSISPKVATQMLLNQRNLLYLGLKQHHRQEEFEHHVINDDNIKMPDGKVYNGLQAALARRMLLQYELWGFHLFIHEDDLVGSKEDFIGLARRYLANSQK